MAHAISNRLPLVLYLIQLAYFVGCHMASSTWPQSHGLNHKLFKKIHLEFGNGVSLYMSSYFPINDNQVCVYDLTLIEVRNRRLCIVKSTSVQYSGM